MQYLQDKRQRELDTFKTKFSSFVGESNGAKDAAIKNLETGYETRIAELIVAHEDRVREFEAEANELVQHELERVEMDFERDRERFAEDQAKKIASLQASHEAAINQLEDQLSKAEERAADAVLRTKVARRAFADSQSQVNAEIEPYLNAIHNSIEGHKANSGAQVLVRCVDTDNDTITFVIIEENKCLTLHIVHWFPTFLL